MNDNKQYIFDNPKNVKLLVKALYACCFILFTLDLVIHRHIYHPWEEFTGFYAFYGCLACVVLVLLAREMRKVVMRDEDYYEKDENNVQSVEKKKEDLIKTGEKVDG